MNGIDVVSVLVAIAALLSALSTIAALATRAAVAELKADMYLRVARLGKEIAENYWPRSAGERTATKLEDCQREHATARPR